jgi:hypothetical protein
MNFLREDGDHQSDEILNIAVSAVANAKFLFDTNELFQKSAIAVPHSKQKTDLPFHAIEALRKSDFAVTHSQSMPAQISIRYKRKLDDTPPLPEKMANSRVRAPRA